MLPSKYGGGQKSTYCTVSSQPSTHTFLYLKPTYPGQSVDLKLAIFGNFEVGQNPWFPSTWTSKALDYGLTNIIAWKEIHLLYSMMVLSISAAFLSVLLLHSRAYSYARVRTRKSALAFKFIARAFGKLMLMFPSQHRALVTKEAKIIARDIGQAVQLLVAGSYLGILGGHMPMKLVLMHFVISAGSIT